MTTNQYVNNVKTKEEVLSEMVAKKAAEVVVPMQIIAVVSTAVATLVTNPEVIKIIVKAIMDIQEIEKK